jgi:GH24 family phage-related lysozyme (muramidase)
MTKIFFIFLSAKRIYLKKIIISKNEVTTFMNWYKTASYCKISWDWKKFLEGIGISVLAIPTALSIILSLNLGKPDVIKALNESGGSAKVFIDNLSKQKNPDKNYDIIDNTERPSGIQPETNANVTPQSYDLDRVLRTIARHEGLRNWVYDDATGRRLSPGQRPQGNRTIGVGLNIGNPHGLQILTNIVTNPRDVYNGSASITNEQAIAALDESVRPAINDAMNFLGAENFESQPVAVQEALINMSFNLGGNRLGNFRQLRQALLDRNYERASQSMLSSRWASQVGNRATELANAVRQAR